MIAEGRLPSRNSNSDGKIIRPLMPFALEEDITQTLIIV